MGATFSRVKTWIDAEYLYASDINAEFDNILNNLTPSGVDDASATDVAMRATADPYSGGAINKPVDLLGEIQRLRYMVQQLHGREYWYLPPLKTIWIPANEMTPAASNGPAEGSSANGTNNLTLPYLAFDGATEETAFAMIQFDPSWLAGTIKAKAVWAGSTGCSAADTVEWEISATAINDDEVIGSHSYTSQVISDAVTADNGTDLQITSATPEITVGGTPGLNSMIAVRVSRNVGGTDNMTEDARLFGILIQYKCGVSNVVEW